MNVFKFLVKNTSAVTASGCRSRKSLSLVREGSACAINALTLLRHFVSIHAHTIIYACTHKHF